MKSRWYKLKNKAIKLRKNGFSIGKIEHRLGIPRSTLSGWFKNIKLTQKQKEKLLRGWKNSLAKARKKAILWHNEQKEKRLKMAKEEALKTLEKISINDPNTVELALSMLYLGEGTKKANETALGSSDPSILKFFLSALKNVYNLDATKIRCDLNLRADQNPIKMKSFWAKTLKLAPSNFKNINKDKRTIGSKTYSDYRGVCHIKYGSVAIQRKLINIGNLFCQKIINSDSGTWRSG